MDGFKPFIKHFSASVESIDRGTKYAIDTSISLCLEHNCKSIFVFVPNHSTLDVNPFASDYRKYMSKYVSGNNQIFIDTTNKIRALGSAGYSPFGIHPSPDSYVIIAEAIGNELTNSKNN